MTDLAHIDGVVWIAESDLDGSEMERPFMRYFVIARTRTEATRKGTAILGADEKLRQVVPFQPILDGVKAGVEAGTEFAISFKDENGKFGPVVITNLDLAPKREDGALVVGVPFGSDPDWQIALPWMSRPEAVGLARYLGLDLDES